MTTIKSELQRLKILIQQKRQQNEQRVTVRNGAFFTRKKS
jgi:hypothetical protein